jgi:hypothetical protein
VFYRKERELDALDLVATISRAFSGVKFSNPLGKVVCCHSQCLPAC